MRESDEIIYSRFMKYRREEDLGLLLDRYQNSLLLFLYGYVNSMEDAEELMLDSFAAAAAGRSIFYGKSSFKTWLFAIARNQARMHLRKNRPVTVSADELPERADREENQPEYQLLQDEKHRRLHQAMKKLTPDAQHVLYLLYFEEMSYEETAQVIGKSRRQTYHLADRCRTQLKKILESEGYYED